MSGDRRDAISYPRVGASNPAGCRPCSLRRDLCVDVLQVQTYGTSVVASQDVDDGADENARNSHFDGQIQGCADVDAADNRVGYRDCIDDEGARTDGG